MQSTSYPKLWTAAWSPRERYTFEDVKSVVAYASAQGVVVVPEFDTPGHATSMCFAYPELCCSEACGYKNNNPLSPVPDANGKNVSLDAIRSVLTELATVYPGEFYHLGGDEVDQSCWVSLDWGGARGGGGGQGSRGWRARLLGRRTSPLSNN